MNYRIEEKPSFLLTGYKRRFTGVPGERDDQEQGFYAATRVNQYILQGLASIPYIGFNVIDRIDDTGYDFYIAAELPDALRDRLEEEQVLGAEYAARFQHIAIPAGTYAIFETDRCRYPTLQHNALRRQIAEDWLPSSGYQLSDRPEIVMSFWYHTEPEADRRYIQLWIPVEKKLPQ